MSNGNEQGDNCGDLNVGIGDNNSMNLICDEQTQNITNGEATELLQGDIDGSIHKDCFEGEVGRSEEVVNNQEITSVVRSEVHGENKNNKMKLSGDELVLSEEAENNQEMKELVKSENCGDNKNTNIEPSGELLRGLPEVVRSKEYGDRINNKLQLSCDLRVEKQKKLASNQQQKIEKFFQKIPMGPKPLQRLNVDEVGDDTKVISKSVVRMFDCVVRRKYCTTHEKPADRITSSRECWTRNKKSGLYSYVRRKVTGWRCEGGTALDISTK